MTPQFFNTSQYRSRIGTYMKKLMAQQAAGKQTSYQPSTSEILKKKPVVEL